MDEVKSMFLEYPGSLRARQRLGAAKLVELQALSQIENPWYGLVDTV